MQQSITKTYYYIVTKIGGLNILPNNLFIYKEVKPPRQKHEFNVGVIL